MNEVLQLLGVDDAAELAAVSELGNMWLRESVDESAEWDKGGFAYVRSPEELRILIEEYGASVVVLKRDAIVVAYSILFDQVPTIEDDPEFLSEPWIPTGVQEFLEETYPDVRFGYLYHIAVHPGFVRQGLATRLFEEMVLRAKSLELDLLVGDVLARPVDNVASFKFLETVDFQSYPQLDEEDDESFEGETVYWRAVVCDIRNNG